MKNLSYVLTICLFLFLLSYISCKGPEGPVGPAGTPGTTGVQGAQGPAGPAYEQYTEDFNSGTIDSPLTTSGDSLWYVMYAYWGGSDFDMTELPTNWAVNGNIDNDQSSTLGIEVNMPHSGVLFFDAFIASEQGYDYLIWTVDNDTIMGISGLGGPFNFHVAIPEGNHTITWKYFKDGSSADYGDRGGIDNIIITNFSTGRLAEPELPESVIRWSDRPLRSEKSMKR